MRTSALGEFLRPVKKPQNLARTSVLALAAPGARHCCTKYLWVPRGTPQASFKATVWAEKKDLVASLLRSQPARQP